MIPANIKAPKKDKKPAPLLKPARNPLERQEVVPERLAMALVEFFTEDVKATVGEVREAAQWELKETEMDKQPEALALLAKFDDPQKRGGYQQQLVTRLVGAGVRMATTGRYAGLYEQRVVGKAAEDLNATVFYLGGTNFQAWKALVNLLRMIKAGSQRRVY